MPPPARALPEEVVEQILLRLPPHKPESLIRASLATKPWLALVSGARFRVRYREFHGAPTMLGFLVYWPWSDLGLRPDKGDPVLPLLSTTKFCARIPDGFEHKDYGVWDCRHGRVLLGEKNAVPKKLAVWDPMTGRQRELQEPAAGGLVVEHEDGHLGAAVLCAVSGCDHRACKGPSRVVFFCLNYVGSRFVAQAFVSLLETSDRVEPHTDFLRGEWSEPCSGLPIDPAGFIEPNPPVLVKDAIHFMLAYDYEFEEHNDRITSVRILTYDLSSHCLSLIDAPSAAAHTSGNPIFMAMENGSLGFARTKKLTLTIWSREMGSDGVAAWTRSRVISLQNIPPINGPRKFCGLLGSMEGNHIIFLYRGHGIYKLNLKTLRRKKIWEGEDLNINALIPYMSFYNPQEMVRMM